MVNAKSFTASCHAKQNSLKLQSSMMPSQLLFALIMLHVIQKAGNSKPTIE